MQIAFVIFSAKLLFSHLLYLIIVVIMNLQYVHRKYIDKIINNNIPKNVYIHNKYTVSNNYYIYNYIL
jgi:hypothetical protein